MDASIGIKKGALCASILSLALGGFSLPAKASISIFDKSIQTYRPDPTDELAKDLAEFHVRILKEKVLVPGDAPEYVAFMSQLRVGYEATSAANIEKFAIVQYVRGCQFNSELAPLGPDEKTPRIVRTSPYGRVLFGTITPFHHPKWIVDSESDDPSYSSGDREGRFELLRWNQDPASLEFDKASWYLLNKPPHGAVFLGALPGSAQLLDAGPRKLVSNLSLQFKTCLFRASDVPHKSDPSGTGLDSQKAIKCFDWSSSFVYDYARSTFVSPAELDPYCTRAL